MVLRVRASLELCVQIRYRALLQGFHTLYDADSYLESGGWGEGVLIDTDMHARIDKIADNDTSRKIDNVS